MNFDEMLRRGDLANLSSYLMCGSDYLVEPPQGTYAQRIKDAEEKACRFFGERFAGRKEYDLATECFWEQAAVFQDVYFELGLALGAKVALQLSKRLG